MPRADTPRPASAVWLRRWRGSYGLVAGGVSTQSDLAAHLVSLGYRCSARTVRRWERTGPPAWVRRVLEGR